MPNLIVFSYFVSSTSRKLAISSFMEKRKRTCPVIRLDWDTIWHRIKVRGENLVFEQKEVYKWAQMAVSGATAVCQVVRVKNMFVLLRQLRIKNMAPGMQNQSKLTRLPWMHFPTSGYSKQTIEGMKQAQPSSLCGGPAQHRFL